MVFSHLWIDILGEKVMGGGGWWPVGLYCQPQSHSFSSGLWILDLDFGLDLGLTNLVARVGCFRTLNL